MPNKISHFDTPPSGVDRACQIARNLFNHARGNHETDADAINAIAHQSRLTPAALRRFLQPSRKPKDVSLGVWGRLVGAYRRYLQRELAELQLEIDRLAHLDPDDGALLSLLSETESLQRQIRDALPPEPSGTDE